MQCILLGEWRWKQEKQFFPNLLLYLLYFPLLSFALLYFPLYTFLLSFTPLDLLYFHSLSFTFLYSPLLSFISFTFLHFPLLSFTFLYFRIGLQLVRLCKTYVTCVIPGRRRVETSIVREGGMWQQEMPRWASWVSDCDLESQPTILSIAKPEVTQHAWKRVHIKMLDSPQSRAPFFLWIVVFHSLHLQVHPGYFCTRRDCRSTLNREPSIWHNFLCAEILTKCSWTSPSVALWSSCWLSNQVCSTYSTWSTQISAKAVVDISVEVQEVHNQFRCFHI